MVCIFCVFFFKVKDNQKQREQPKNEERNREFVGIFDCYLEDNHDIEYSFVPYVPLEWNDSSSMSTLDYIFIWIFRLLFRYLSFYGANEDINRCPSFYHPF